ESNHSDFNYKSATIQFFSSIYSNPQTITDIFVNYDCSLNVINIFARSVIAVCKVVQSKSNTPNIYHLRLLGLQCLVTVLSSIATWSMDLYRPLGAESMKYTIRNFYE